MKIGIDACCWSNQRGYGRFTRELLKALLKMSSPHTFIFFCDRATDSQLKIPAGNHKKVLVPLGQNVTEAASASGSRSAIDILRMSRAVQRESLDAFFFPSTYSYFPIFNRCRVAVTIHDTIAELFPELIFSSPRARLFWNLKTRMAIKQADIIFTVSEFSRSCIEKVFKIPQDQIEILLEAPNPFFYDSVSKAEEKAVFEKTSMETNEPFFLYLGGISPNKNLGCLIDAFESDAFSKCKLILVGDYVTDPFISDFTNLKSQIERSPAKDRILLTGYLDDSEIRALLKHTVALVLPSFHEGFGLPAAEAMAAGAAVIATSNSAIPEISNGGAIQIDPENVDTIIHAMKSVLNEPLLKQRIAAAGHEAVRKLSWEASAQKLLVALTL